VHSFVLYLSDSLFA